MVARFLIARNVMFLGKQTTARKKADQLKNCINQRLRVQCELLTQKQM